LNIRKGRGKIQVDRGGRKEKQEGKSSRGMECSITFGIEGGKGGNGTSISR